ncbi:MAG: pullulanase-associated domain-containing protein, partial [Phycisphaerales bacterium]
MLFDSPLICRLRVLLTLTVCSVLSIAPAPATASAADPVSIADRIDMANYDQQSVVIVHYYRPDGDYTDWNLWAWSDDNAGAQHDFTGETEFSR